MSSFNDRKDAFEKKFAHDQDMRFKIEARTSKLFGLWAAEQLGLRGADAETYAKEVVASNLEEAGFDDIRRKVSADFAAKKLTLTAHTIDVQLDAALLEAQKQISAA